MAVLPPLLDGVLCQISPCFGHLWHVAGHHWDGVADVQVAVAVKSTRQNWTDDGSLRQFSAIFTDDDEKFAEIVPG